MTATSGRATTACATSSRSSSAAERSSAAAPYTFEPHGQGVVVAGHRRIGEGSDYLYFSHHVEDGAITRIAAWFTRDAAIADVT